MNPPPPHAGASADDFALAARSTPLARVIADEIAHAGGRITFARFMALALGHPEHGYYSRRDLAWGARGDFETSPEVTPVFGYLWARQIVECWERLGAPDTFTLVEPGAGSGALLASLLGWLREHAPACFAAVHPVMLDAHVHRIEQQRETLRAHGLAAAHHTLDEWLASAPSVTGVILSNELFDALPVHLVEQRDDPHTAAPVLHEWYVTNGAGGGFAFALDGVSTPEIAEHFAMIGVQPAAECRVEVSLAAPALLQRLAATLRRGYLISIDYGYDADALYAPWRRAGTLLAFRDHSPQPDPLASPGLLDLTAHVDWTSLATAGAQAGCTSAPLTTQAEALVALGIGEALAAAHAHASENALAYAQARRAVDTLLDPAGLGRIRVLVQAKDAPLEGLRCLSR